ncbi:hypothetical protein IWX46DRAFT_590655 [Phyllosticta citricarpa]|uniref:Uncharacterized protein n=1 Tax=Phyllosticta citricarpa TaxID=55181 RepID=A0ABR1MMH5_9PEZI
MRDSRPPVFPLRSTRELPALRLSRIRLEECSGRQPRERSSDEDVLSSTELGRSSRHLGWLVVVDASPGDVGRRGSQSTQDGTASSIGRCEGGRGARRVVGSHASRSRKSASANKVSHLCVSVVVSDETVGAVWKIGPRVLLVAHAINVSLLNSRIIVAVVVAVVIPVVIAVIVVAVVVVGAGNFIPIRTSVVVKVQRAVAEEVDGYVCSDFSCAVGENGIDWLALAAAVSRDVVPVQVRETKAHESEEREDCECGTHVVCLTGGVK